MKLSLVFVFALCLDATSQVTTDSSVNTGRSIRFSDYKAQKRIVSNDKVALWTENMVLTAYETEIMNMESREIEALLRRDTSSLRKIWSRDFTLDDTNNGQVMSSNNPLPFYVSLHRLIEGLTKIENIVSAHGYETYQLLKPNGKPAPPVRRSFSHMWIRKNGEWTLLTKSH
jgi:hypothetical protein